MSLTRQERAELLSLIKKRERVMKSAAEERAAKMLAEFETQISQIYNIDDDTIWKSALTEAKAAVATAREAVAARCKELGIPPEFGPDIQLNWYGRGQNAFQERRSELRAAAKAKIAAAQREAERAIERLSLQSQTELLASGLVSEAAKSFLNELGTVEDLMPAIDANATRQEIEDKKRRGENRISLAYDRDDIG